MIRRVSFMMAGLAWVTVVAATGTVEAGDLWRNSPLNSHLRFWSAGVGAGYHAGNGWRPHRHVLQKQPCGPWSDTPCDVAQGVSPAIDYWRAARQSQLYSPQLDEPARDVSEPIGLPNQIPARIQE